MKKVLAKNSSTLHKSSTVVLSTVLAILAGLEIANQSIGLLSPVTPEGWYPWISFSMAVAIGVGRYIKQRCVSKDNQKDSEDEDVGSGSDNSDDVHQG